MPEQPQTSRDFAIDVVQRLVSAGYTAYFAGGCVRDLLMNRVPNDFDVATNARPDQVREVFGKRRTVAVGESFGVILVTAPKPLENVEVATFRTEGDYRDGRRPSHVAFCSPEEDAHRRDFTINGMFFDPLSDTVHDFVGGQDDLEKRVVRAIGDPRARMSEDKLRMLRAVRFATVLNFHLDGETFHAIEEMVSEIVVVSAERIAQELRKMLVHPERRRACELMRELRLLDVILPEVEAHAHENEEAWTQRIEILAALGPATFPAAFATLLHDLPTTNWQNRRQGTVRGSVAEICQRLRLSNDETDRICWLVEQHGSLDNVAERTRAQLIRTLVHPGFEELRQIEEACAKVAGHSLEPFALIDSFLKETPPEELSPPEILTGRDLIQAGYRPGPRFSDWLNRIRDAQLNGELKTRDEALARVAQWAGGQNA